MSEGRPVSCGKCKCHCVGLYYTSSQQPGYNLCLKCQLDAAAHG
jgi:hypothetical protein